MKKRERLDNCFICGNRQITKEHIIPNALGGVLKPALLCPKCNNDLGSEVDAHLIKTLSWFTYFVQPKRNRGKNPEHLEILLDGSAVDWYPNRQVKTCKTFKRGDGKFEVRIIADNEKVAKDVLLKTFVKKLAVKRHWNLKQQNDFLENNLDLRPAEDCSLELRLIFGDELDNLALLKILINFAIYIGVDKQYLEEPISILRNQRLNDVNNLVHLFYPKGYLTWSAIGIVHSIILIGNPKENILYGIVSLYGAYQGIVLLSDKYTGETFCETYFWDVWNHQKITSFRENKFLLKKNEVLGYLNTDPEILYPAIVKAFNNFRAFITNKVQASLTKSVESMCDAYLRLSREAMTSLIFDNPLMNREEFLMNFPNEVVKRQSSYPELESVKSVVLRNYAQKSIERKEDYLNYKVAKEKLELIKTYGSIFQRGLVSYISNRNTDIDFRQYINEFVDKNPEEGVNQQDLKMYVDEFVNMKNLEFSIHCLIENLKNDAHLKTTLM